MRVLVTGGTGFVGRALVRALFRRDDRVTVLTRDTAAARKLLHRDVRVARWQPDKPGAWQQEVGVVDAVVHLAGAPVAARWTNKTKRRMTKSRVDSARLIVEALADAKTKPSVIVTASATGYYGVNRKRTVDESSEAGDGFLSELCQAWESEAQRASEHGVRNAQLRLGVVIGPNGGALSRMIAPMRLFVAGPIGRGDNTMSWVHIDDVVGMILWAIENDEVSGAINCTSPNVTTGRELAEKMGSVLGRPAIGTPERVVRALMGDATDVIVGNLSVYPQRAVDLGYEFHHARLVPALEAALMPDA